MELRNGDSLAGEVVAITDGMIKRENGDVRGWLPDGSSGVFRLEGRGPMKP